MTHFEATAPSSSQRQGQVRLLVSGKSKDLGGFSVRRVLPADTRQAVGPFVFVDEMGPADFGPGQGMNVRPHPHIGIATVTYLFAGEIIHRDSLGVTQPIEPGAVNLMTAGRGIVHSERTRPELLEAGQKLHGIQSWMALPMSLQETEPQFAHYPAEELPTVSSGGVETTIVIGNALGKRSPVDVRAETLYLVQRYGAGTSSTLPQAAERAVYVIAGSLRIGNCELTEGTMGIVSPGAVTVTSSERSHCIVIGGEPVGPRHLWWNLVHTDPERIEQAKRDWTEGRFQMIDGDDEFIPLPSE